jgi:uncharacterized protein (TIGR02646 family)
MKYVQKGGPPHGYRQWCRDVHGTDNEDYREIPAGIKAVLLVALVQEQGGICAYTMKRIDKDTSHIEHIKPESLCRDDTKGSDLDFANVVACFPRDGMRRACRYGAQKKDNWWDATLFVSPLDPACERRFHFNREGEISTVGTNAAADRTIAVLRLDHPTLTEDRNRAIEEFLYGQHGDEPLSRAKASRLQREVCTRSAGRFVEFCVALRDALDEHVKYIEKVTRKRAFAKRRKR